MAALRAALATVATALAGVPGRAHAIEEPAYTVVAEHDDWELRAYASSIQAQVTVEGPWDQAVTSGFRVLAGYIFGGNQPRAEIAMTAPVAATRATGGQEIAMTAPVAAQAAGAERWTVAFTMPASWTMDRLPVPDDPRIELVEIAPHHVAALRFGLWATEARVADRTARLLAAAQEAGLVVTGEPIVAQYNPPWTPPPLRRNEILVPVRDPA